MSDAPTAVVSSAPEPAKLTEAQRLGYVFSAPSRTFADLKRSAAWWAPFLIIVLTSALYAFAVQTKVGWAQASENIMNAYLAGRDIPEEQRAAIIAGTENRMRYGSYFAAVQLLILFAIAAGIYLFIFNFGLGTAHTYKFAYAAVLYAAMGPMLLRTLLAVLTLFAGVDPEGFMMDDPVASNLGVLVNRTESRALYTFLSWIDAFTIWTVVLLGIAFTTGTKLKRSTGIVTVGAVYLLVALAFTGLAAL